MGIFDLPYRIGTPPARDGPLARFLPPLEEGIFPSWLADHIHPGAWVLDPFGLSPRPTLEAARAGYRVLVTVNNPIARFLLEMTAAPPRLAELKAALADLAITKKGDERLETHLQSLYLTPCLQCHREIPARAFLWRKGEVAPFARRYQCPACGHSGEYPATEADVEQAQRLAEIAGLHRARLIERVARPDDPDRQFVEEALSVYLPRALYVLAILNNRLDAPGITPNRRRLLSALFLSICDRANMLWRIDSERPRPRLLTPSHEFLEHNLWLALEEAVAIWADEAPAVPVHTWPARLPKEGGILIFEGRLADLAARLQDIPVAAVITVLPRPNQAFWTLSALWAGWLWGSKAAEPFHLVLRRRRYDWAWHLDALRFAFRHLAHLIRPGVPCLALLPEPEPAFLTVALAAAEVNGFQLQGLALRTDHDPIQIEWSRGESLHHQFTEPDPETIRSAIHHHLRTRGEPTGYLPLHAAALVELIASHALIHPNHPSEEVLRHTLHLVHTTLQGDPQLTHYGGGENPESGLWGLSSRQETLASLPDRVEEAIVTVLIRRAAIPFPDLLSHLSTLFPGLLTPSLGLVQAVLASYAEETQSGWALRPSDQPAARRAELRQLAEHLHTLGERLEYHLTCLHERLLLWEIGEEAVYAFHLKASTILVDVLASPFPLERTVIVLPEERLPLLRYKLDRDPSLADRFRARLLPFSTLRALAQRSLVDRDTFEAHLLPFPASPQWKLF